LIFIEVPPQFFFLSIGLFFFIQFDSLVSILPDDD
jgi:hypothetical protein